MCYPRVKLHSGETAFAFSFYAALAIGIGALTTSIFTSTAVALGFTVVFDLFYLFFAVRFINYALRFSIIEEAMESDTPEETTQHNHVLPPAIVSTIAPNACRQRKQE